MVLARKHRLGGVKVVEKIFSQGRTVRGSFFFIRRVENPLGYGRAAIIVPLKVSKKATYRNKIRRLLSQAIKEHKLMDLSLDLLVNISPAIVDKSPKEIKREFSEAIKKIFVNKK